ncbi:MAG: hydantoinase/oxoprolinase family protein, partial [bacterium]
EMEALDAAVRAGVLATATHQISGLYGLRARTRTAIVNAAILPKMLDAALKTRESMNRLGVDRPLMIMRSDGGVMNADRVRVKPIETILSGPAAGVSAAILHERLASGVFVEVGGTSTDVSVVLNGRPTRKNAVVGTHALHLKTLDVRTAGVAGGSMPRIRSGKIADVGPRSAHIAGLPYSCYLDPENLRGAVIETAAPLPGDPCDYAVLRLASGGRAAITNTCAANFLGFLPAGDYAAGNTVSARAAFEALGAALGMPPEKAAEEMIRLSVEKLRARVEELIAEYARAEDVNLIVGGGGGASVLAPALSRGLALHYRQAKSPELVSAIGVAMALTKTTVERSVVNPTESDVRRVRSEAVKALLEQGCDPDGIEVQIEIDAKRNTIRAEAEGSSALVSGRRTEKITREEASAAAAAQLPPGCRAPTLEFEDGGTFVFRAAPAANGTAPGGKRPEQYAIVVDSFGLVRLNVRGGEVFVFGRNDAGSVGRAAQAGLHYGDGGVTVKPMHLVYGGRTIDLSRLGTPDRIVPFIEMEIRENPSFGSFCLVVKT